MPKHMTLDELTDHAQDCYKYANAMRFLGNHANADAALRWAKRAQYRAMEIEAGRPDPAFDENKPEENEMKYIPQIGDSVAARRKIESKIYANLIVGPVIDTWDNACRIVTNKGTDIESDFKLHFSDWDFQYLHKTNQAQNDQEIKEKDPEGYARMIRNRELIERIANGIHTHTK